MQSRGFLHHFTRRVKVAEVKTALLLLLFGVVAVSLLEDRVVDPWGVFNPRKFGILVLTLAGLEFASHILTKVLGKKSSSLALGFLGGFVSSTAVLIAAGRRANTMPEIWRQQVVSGLAGKLAALIEVLIIVALTSPPLVLTLAIPITSTILVGLIALIYLARDLDDKAPKVKLQSPIDWRAVFWLAFMLAGVLAIVALAQKALGENGTLAISFVGGLFELHGISLANSTMLEREQIAMSAAYLNIMMAITASLFAKIAMSWMVTRNKFSQTITTVFLLMIGALWFSTLFFNH